DYYCLIWLNNAYWVF
nr:immunoglobulin light chain junction region [Macaca mulatta]MOX83505.1 immunoglobulin light chain junction region [Macaca mulatta]MOY05576.1 immunoglobulin light chain junction region [Macaca mulatta]